MQLCANFRFNFPKDYRRVQCYATLHFRDLRSLHTKEHWRDKRGNYPGFEIQLSLDRVLAQCFCSLSFGFKYLLSADKNNKKRNIHWSQQDETYTRYGHSLGGEWDVQNFNQWTVGVSTVFVITTLPQQMCYTNCIKIALENGCAACVMLRKIHKWVCFLLYFRALAASAPIWQFPGMVPCGDFYKIVTQDFAKSGFNCDASIRKSWNAIKNVSSTGKSSSQDGFIYLLCHIIGLF